MSLKDYLSKGWLKEEPTSRDEIIALFAIVKRDYEDSGKDVTLDWQFGIAYNAALKLATILIRASGFRVKGHGHHMNIISLIPVILGKHKQDDCDYLDTCRRKRNLVEYDCVNGASESDVRELRSFVLEFSSEVLDWLRMNYEDVLIELLVDEN